MKVSIVSEIIARAVLGMSNHKEVVALYSRGQLTWPPDGDHAPIIIPSYAHPQYQ